MTYERRRCILSGCMDWKRRMRWTLWRTPLALVPSVVPDEEGRPSLEWILDGDDHGMNEGIQKKTKQEETKGVSYQMVSFSKRANDRHSD